jgi:hypothetical protein
MREESEIRVHLREYTILFEIRQTSRITESGTNISDEPVKISFRSFTDISPPWFDKSPKKQYSLGDMLKVYFLRMKRKSKLFSEKISDNGNT